MRFRLATTGFEGQGGFGRGLQSLFATPMLRAQAAEEAQTAGMKRQLLESQIANQVAQAAQTRGETEAIGRAPDVFETIIAGQAGTNVPTLNRWRDSVRTGVQPTTSATGDADTDTAIGIAPQPAIDPGVAAKLLQQFQRMAPGMVNPKGLQLQDMSKATGEYQDQDVLTQALELAKRGDDMGMSRINAVRGKKEFSPFKAVGNTGVALNEVTGAGTVADQGLRALFGDQGAALVTQRKAAAGASGAQAGLSNARRERVTGGYDKPVTVLDEDSGEAQITRIPTGQQPVTVGVAPKKQTGTDATNAKERNRVVRDVEKEMVGASDAEISAEVSRRMARRGTSAAPTPPKPAGGAPAPNIDTNQANKIKADYKAGKLTREQATAQLRALGFK
jgi:hypothetical protein